ncbi:CLUMA_CG014618, isoform A [Clunio marinus]|uniref:CLUMA_CG014618, isoform A n=1 Tax=Clunio marinus TaxID=568069 RepID=A0A1J1IMM0_9DIPT|nr:CLUMA_CG014618, isoform A [Clunio marinus]
MKLNCAIKTIAVKILHRRQTKNELNNHNSKVVTFFHMSELILNKFGIYFLSIHGKKDLLQQKPDLNVEKIIKK